MELAIQSVEERRLAQRVLLSHEQQGVAPSTAQALERFKQTSLQLLRNVRSPCFGAVIEATF